MLTVEQIVAAQKAQVSTAYGLSAKALESVEKYAELNLQAAKAALAESATVAKSVLAAKDVQELLALQAALLQPTAEKASAYARHVYDIATGAGAEFSKVAESQATDAQKQFLAAVDSAAKSAPQGSEPAVALVKSAVASANNALESVQKVVKQATEMAEANFNAVAASATAAPAKGKKAAA